MAKRIRMDSSLLKTLQVQSLMNTPEADKLRRLDKKITDIVNDKNLKSQEKINKFEETLAMFKNVQNKIIKQGGVSLVNNTQQEFIDALKKVLEEISAVRSQNSDYTISTDGYDADDRSDISSLNPSAYSTPQSKHEDDADITWHNDADEWSRGYRNSYRDRFQQEQQQTTPKSNSPGIKQPKFTPTEYQDNEDAIADISGAAAAAVPTPGLEVEVATNTKASKQKAGTPKQEKTAAILAIEKFLQEQGLNKDTKEGKINAGKLKIDPKKNAVFALSTYYSALNYLTTPNAELKKPYKSDNLINIIYETIKERDPQKFKQMKKVMPNLKKLDREQTKKDSINNWVSM